jgi:hypothetical protein
MMAHKLTTVTAIGVLVAAAGFPLAVGQDARRTVQGVGLQEEIRVYEMSAVSDDRGEIESWFRQVRGLLPIDAASIGASAWAVRAMPEDHERLVMLIDQAAATHGEHESYDEADEDDDEDTDTVYTVRVFAGLIEQHTAPDVGERFPGEHVDVIAAPQVTIEDGEEASVSALRLETFIAGYLPVVGTNAVGYQVQTETVEMGFEMEMEIEAEEDGRVEVGIEGWFAEGEVRDESLRLGDATLPIGLPVINRRSIESEVMLALDSAPIIVSSLPGMGPDQRLIIGLSVRAFEPAPQDQRRSR